MAKASTLIRNAADEARQRGSWATAHKLEETLGAFLRGEAEEAGKAASAGV